MPRFWDYRSKRNPQIVLWNSKSLYPTLENSFSLFTKVEDMQTYDPSSTNVLKVKYVQGPVYVSPEISLDAVKSSDLDFTTTQPVCSGGVCPSRRKHFVSSLISQTLKQLSLLSVPLSIPSQTWSPGSTLCSILTTQWLWLFLIIYIYIIEVTLVNKII